MTYINPVKKIATTPSLFLGVRGSCEVAKKGSNNMQKSLKMPIPDTATASVVDLSRQV